MGNPMDEVRAQMAQAALDQLPELTEKHRTTLTMVINAVTEGWRCEKKIGSRPVYEESRVHYEITTPTRPFTEEEKAEEEAWRRRVSWRPEQGPPPSDIGMMRLLDQHVWWVSKDGSVNRLVDMHPNHRKNLYAMLLRNAKRLHLAESFRYASAPDGIMEEFDAIPPEKWLKGTSLMKRLRKLIKLDAKAAKFVADARAQDPVRVAEDLSRSDLEDHESRARSRRQHDRPATWERTLDNLM